VVSQALPRTVAFGRNRNKKIEKIIAFADYGDKKEI
jgi:hypothetical protein